MAKANPSKRSKTKMTRKTRRNMRWTIAALFMVTAFVIALIPIQNGGVSATAITSIPDLDTIANYGTDKLGVISDTISSVSPQGTIDYLGFPLMMLGETSISDDCLGQDGDNIILTPIANTSNREYTYKVYDKDNNEILDTLSPTDTFFVMSPTLPSNETKKYIYTLKSYETSGTPNTISKYYGDENSYPAPGGTVPLEAGSVGYNPSWENYEFRKIRVITEDIEVDPETGTTTRVPVSDNTYCVCSNRCNIEYIADNAFTDTDPAIPKNIKNITLPNTLKKIGNRAFQGQSYLNSLNGGSDLVSIGRLAFEGCSLQGGVSFADNCPAEYIGDGAFANTNISTIVFPETIKVIGSGAFYNCPLLNDCAGEAVDENSSILFSKTKDAQPHPIKLGNYVFAKDEGLKGIALDKMINDIGDGLFAGCTSLSTVVLPRDYVGTLDENTFFGVNDLEYIRTPDTNTSFKYAQSDGEEVSIFITSMNQEQNTPSSGIAPDITQNNPLFALWGPKPSVTSQTHEYAKEYGITYMYVGDDGNLHYELTLNGYTFEFDENGVITSCTATEYANNTLAIPPQIGDIPIVEIAPGAFKNMLALDGKPNAVSIPDSVKKIGDEAFMNCADITKVEIETSGVDIGKSAFANNSKLKEVLFTQTTTTGDTTIGENCFANDPILELVSFRNTDLSREDINVVNVTEIGANAFKTGNDNGLTIRGKMEPGYKPYEFAIDPNNRTSTGIDSYITYETGNPENLVCRYDGIENCVELKSYPCSDTIVGTDDAGNAVTIHDLEQKMASYLADRDNNPQPTVMEAEILKAYKNITIPKGIDNIEDASAKDCTIVGQNMMRDLNEPDGASISGVACTNEHAIHDLTFDGIKVIPANSISNDKNLTNLNINGDIDLIGDQALMGCTSLTNVNLGSVDESGNPLPIKDIGKNVFRDCSSLADVNIIGNVTDEALTSDVFYNCSSLKNVKFIGEGDKSSATKADPYYWCEGGIIYKYDGELTYLVECLPGVDDTVTAIPDVDIILPSAFENCDKIETVDLSPCTKLEEIPDKCFYDCDRLSSVILPEKCSTIGEKAFDIEAGNATAASNKLDVHMNAHEIYISMDAFENRVDPIDPERKNNTVHSYDDSAAKRYAKKMPNVNFISDINDPVTATFIYYVNDEVVVEDVKVPYGDLPAQYSPTVPTDGRKGYIFTKEWDSSLLNPLYADKKFRALYEPDSSSSTSSSSTSKTTSSSSGGSGGSTSGGSTSSSKSTSSSSTARSSSGSSSGSSTRNTPVVVSGAPAPYSGVGLSSATAPTGSTTTGGGNNVQTGNTNAVSTAGGLDSSKLSATVNGSSDNYVIKITETSEADELAKQALTGEFGSLDNIRYYPFDVSLYDSSGTQKISPVPDGVTVSVTMPIPDALTIYGGNNKIGSTIGGTLEKIQPKFTVIDGVPCMNFTVSHLSPYVVYVDTANLTAGGVQDATPKTADPIHPKWFLVIGFAAISIFLFLKRDKQSMPANVA